MPWKHNNIAIKAGKAWSDKDGVQHPANWMIWTDPEKKAKGLTWEDEPDTSLTIVFIRQKMLKENLMMKMQKMLMANSCMKKMAKQNLFMRD